MRIVLAAMCVVGFGCSGATSPPKSAVVVAGFGGASASEQQCAALQARASETLVAAAMSVDGCTADDDCRDVPLAFSCVDCLYIAGNGAVTSAIAAVADTVQPLCNDFQQSGCKLIPSGCPPPLYQCIDHKCRP